MVESATCQDNVVATSCKCYELAHAALTDAHATMAFDIGHCTSHIAHMAHLTRTTGDTLDTVDRGQLEKLSLFVLPARRELAQLTVGLAVATDRYRQPFSRTPPQSLALALHPAGGMATI